MLRAFKTLIACAAAAAVAVALTSARPQGGGPLPPPLAPPENLPTLDKILLGKILFWEEQLSSDDTVACGSCHSPQAGFSDPRTPVNPGPDGVTPSPDDVFGSPGVVRQDPLGDYAPDPMFDLFPQITGRHAPEIVAALYAPEAFWDGRASDTFVDPQTLLVSIPTGGALESQVVGPPLSDVEMAHEARDWGQVAAKLATARPWALATDHPADAAAQLAAHPDYPSLFQAAFGDPAITAERIAFAIASYERTLVPDQTPWDRFVSGQPNAMTPDQIAGWNQFNGPARCANCHTPPLFSDNRFHNLGLRPFGEDAGRMDVTGLFADRGKFKTPSLRNAGLRPRFFHNGSESQLDNGPGPGGVDQVYVNGGGAFRDNLDPLLLPLAGQPGIVVPQIFEFVRNGLTDPRVAAALPPFDRPTLHGQRVPPGTNVFGPSATGSGGLAPGLIAGVPALAGGELKVGVRDARGGASAWLAVSTAAGTGAPVNGVPVNVGLPAKRVLAAQMDGPAGAVGAGYATFRAAIPARSALIGVDLYAQAFVADPAAAAGFAASRGARFTIR
jgi:cytochrome c peroxidase